MVKVIIPLLIYGNPVIIETILHLQCTVSKNLSVIGSHRLVIEITSYLHNEILGSKKA